MPGVAQVVAVRVGHSDERLNGINILLLHFCDAGARCQQGEPGQGLYVCIPLQLLHKNTRRWLKILKDEETTFQIRLQYLYGEDTRYSDCATDPFQTQ